MSEEETPPPLPAYPAVMSMQARVLEEALQLPRDCHILSLKYNQRTRCIDFLVYSPDIPPTRDDQPLPEVILRHSISWPTPEHLAEHPETVTEYRKMTSELQVL